MLVHRSTESLVIERLDIPATESPSNGTHSSSWMKTIESWNMMNYHQSRRGRLRGRWEPWYYDFYNYLKDGFISEYATRGQRRAWRSPTICDLGRCPLQEVLQGRPSLYLIGRRSAHCWTSSFKRQGLPIKSVPSKAWLLRSGATSLRTGDQKIWWRIR